MIGEILDTDYALLPVNGDAEAAIEIDHEAQTASIQNGKITAVVRQSWWDTPERISFYNDKGELLLQETGRPMSSSLTSSIGPNKGTSDFRKNFFLIRRP